MYICIHIYVCIFYLNFFSEETSNALLLHNRDASCRKGAQNKRSHLYHICVASESESYLSQFESQIMSLPQLYIFERCFQLRGYYSNEQISFSAEIWVCDSIHSNYFLYAFSPGLVLFSLLVLSQFMCHLIFERCHFLAGAWSWSYEQGSVNWIVTWILKLHGVTKNMKEQNETLLGWWWSGGMRRG